MFFLQENDVVVQLPVVERCNSSCEDVFLPDSPRNLLDNLHLSSAVPLIIGTNNEEGVFFLSGKWTQLIGNNYTKSYCLVMILVIK